MKQCSVCKRRKSNGSFPKNKNTKDGLSYICRSCHSKDRKAFRESNPEKVKDISRKAQKKYKENHPDKVAASLRKYRQSHKGAINANTAKRNAALLQRTPKNADTKKIAAFYNEAARLTKKTGIPHHIDHIIPLQGRRVSGLHTHHNLQILTRKENQSKGNR